MADTWIVNHKFNFSKIPCLFSCRYACDRKDFSAHTKIYTSLGVNIERHSEYLNKMYQILMVVWGGLEYPSLAKFEVTFVYS